MNKENSSNFLSFFTSLIIFVALLSIFHNVNAQKSDNNVKSGIELSDNDLYTSLVVSGLDFPTGIAFIDDNDFLILEKNTGFVKRVIDDVVQTKPLLELVVDSKDERGLLGMEIDKKPNDDYNYFVYLSYVECDDEVCEFKVTRYELDNLQNRLVNPEDLLSLESFPDAAHVGGVLKIGPDGDIYVTVGDFHRTDNNKIFETQAQNFEDGFPADGRGGILKINSDGFAQDNSIFGDEYPLNLYYAYGIRNSFGMDFDPLTGYLWDTENGPDYGDEINLVFPGFNSGSPKIYGKLSDNFDYKYIGIKEFNDQNSNQLGLLNGEGIYSDPKLSWDRTVAPTSLIFLDSNTLGNNYKYDMLVANAEGTIYHFDLNNLREELFLGGSLSDKIVDSEEEENQIKFAEGFDIITDMEINPYNGYLYVVSSKKGTEGSVYKIMSNNENIEEDGIFDEDINEKGFFQIFQKSNENFNNVRDTRTGEDGQSIALDNLFDLWK